MMRDRKVKLKVCGMKFHENIQSISEVQPDYMGFIFYPMSPRFVGEAFSAPNISPHIQMVGVFVNEEEENILRKSRLLGSDVVQLHGQESATLCGRLQEQGKTVIKAFAMHPHFDFELLTPYEHVVDYFLFDTKGKQPGGNAFSFDWSLLKQYHQRIPFFLSGGLNKHNIAQLNEVLSMNLHALDINSGAEVSAGLKDKSEVAAIKRWLDDLNNS